MIMVIIVIDIIIRDRSFTALVLVLWLRLRFIAQHPLDRSQSNAYIIYMGCTSYIPGCYVTYDDR